jgi:hypothetical protein
MSTLIIHSTPFAQTKHFSYCIYIFYFLIFAMAVCSNEPNFKMGKLAAVSYDGFRSISMQHGRGLSNPQTNPILIYDLHP